MPETVRLQHRSARRNEGLAADRGTFANGFVRFYA